MYVQVIIVYFVHVHVHVTLNEMQHTVEPLYNGHHWDQLLLIEVSFVEGSFSIKMGQEKCPL